MCKNDFRQFKHELRTPINHITGYSELLGELAEEEGDRELVALARSIHSDGHHLAALIEKHLVSHSQVEPDLLAMLLLAVRPAVSSLIARLPGELESRYVDYADDIRKIRSAAERLDFTITEEVEKCGA
jgi:signal transduction histidine kinase